MGVVQKVSMILVAIVLGIAVGAQPILGFNRGAHKPRRMMHTYKLAVLFATVIAVIGWLACILIPDVILQIFCTSDPTFAEFSN